MWVRCTLTTVLCAGLLVAATGCARSKATCPLDHAPAITDYGPAGVSGVYQFVTQGASDKALAAFLRASEAAQFAVVPMTVNINGKDALFAKGPALLRDRDQVDKEFAVACALGRDEVYLAQVRYDPPDPTADGLRVR